MNYTEGCAGYTCCYTAACAPSAQQVTHKKEWANDYAKSDLHFLLSCLLCQCSHLADDTF